MASSDISATEVFPRMCDGQNATYPELSQTQHNWWPCTRNWQNTISIWTTSSEKERNEKNIGKIRCVYILGISNCLIL